MEYILIMVFWVQAQGWSVTTAEFGDQAACESAKLVASEAFRDTAQKLPGGQTTGRALCVPKHSAKS
jgi:hypothetical protein